jgi:peptidoglycan LD-endopeptidase LytH
MTGKMRRNERVFGALAAVFCIGVLVGWCLRAHPPSPVFSPAADTATTPGVPESQSPSAAHRPVATTGTPVIAAAPSAPRDSTRAELGRSPLRMPIDGATVESMKGGFAETRSGGGRPHEAVDILAPRNTSIHAVQDGTIAKLFVSKAGGKTIYQFDPGGHLCYYYAHLERYADGLHEGQRVAQGDVIGYVGTSGNAPPGIPHLHFAVFELGPDRHWWQGRAIDPYLVFQG